MWDIEKIGLGIGVLCFAILAVLAVVAANRNDELREQNFMECIEKTQDTQYCFDMFVE